MKMIYKRMAFIAILFAVVGSAIAERKTASLIATADTYVRSASNQQALNFGGAELMNIGNHQYLEKFHGFLRFDLSSLGRNVEILSVTLQMYKPRQGVGSAFTVNVYELSNANANWDEELATWVKKRGVSAWAGSEGASSAGKDYIDTVLASYGGTIVAGDAVFTSQAAFLTAVERNLGGSLNLGIGIKNSADAQYYRFATRESPYAAPTLIIVYTVKP